MATPMTKNDTETGRFATGPAPRPRLIVLDESRVFASSVQEIAEDMGYQVEVAQQIGQIMTACRAGPPETILIGHVSPETDALQLIAWLGDCGCESKVLVATDGSKPYPKVMGPSHDGPGRLNLESVPRPLNPRALRAALRRDPR